MAEQTEARVAVYIDFDNIVISRYDQVHGQGRFSKDGARNSGSNLIRDRLDAAKISVDAILDYALSFGTMVISRAYADWSVAVNASYKNELNERAVDLTQLFTTTAQLKNGADIRLAVDVVEDLFRLDDITHVVIVAGDSDYISLAQRSRRLGRYVIGIGVAGSTGKYLAAACDEFAYYTDLPGVKDDAVADPTPAPAAESAPAPTTGRRAKSQETTPPEASDDNQRKVNPTDLLVRAMRVGHAKSDDPWLHSGGVKSQMQRMDPSFNEKSLGFSTFSDFLKSRGSVIETGKAPHAGRIRLRPRMLADTQAAGAGTSTSTSTSTEDGA